MPTGLTKDAGWQIGVSRTVNLPLDDVWEFMISPRAVGIWLGEGAELPAARGDAITTADGSTGELRSLRPLDRVRLTWQPQGSDHDTTVQLAVTGGETSTVIRFHQERMVDEAERTRQRDHWRAVLVRLVTELGA